MGLLIISNLGFDGDRYKSGTILDPESGKTYKAELWVEVPPWHSRGEPRSWSRGPRFLDEDEVYALASTPSSASFAAFGRPVSGSQPAIS